MNCNHFFKENWFKIHLGLVLFKVKQTFTVLPKVKVFPNFTSIHPLTYHIEVSCNLLGAKAVGDLTDVVAWVLHAQVTDGKACETPGPAGVSWKWPTILKPTDSGIWKAWGNAWQLHAATHLHFTWLEAVHNWGCGLSRIWSTHKTYCK